jgi:hypothetical protein
VDTAILVLIALVLGGGTAGGVLGAWASVRRTLALKTRVDALELDLELFKRQLVAEVKRRAGQEGLDQRKRNKEIEEMVRNLPTEKKVQPVNNFEPAWWETDVKNARS